MTCPLFLLILLIVIVIINYDLLLRTSCGAALAFAHPSLKGRRDVVTAAVAADPLAIAYAPETLRDDLPLVLLAVGRDGEALRHASGRLRNEPRVVAAACRGGGNDKDCYGRNGGGQGRQRWQRWE